MAEEMDLQNLVNLLDVHLRFLNDVVAKIGKIPTTRVVLTELDVTTFGCDYTVPHLTYEVSQITRISTSGDKS